MKEVITDEAIQNLYFWEELKEVAEAIEGMPTGQQEDYLSGVIKREVGEGVNWRRQILKRLLVDKDQRATLIETIKSGKIYEA